MVDHGTVRGGPSSLALDFVDFDLTTSLMCPILLGQLQIWQNWHSNLATWQNSLFKNQQKLVSGLIDISVFAFAI